MHVQALAYALVVSTLHQLNLDTALGPVLHTLTQRQARMGVAQSVSQDRQRRRPPRCSGVLSWLPVIAAG